MHRLHQVLSLLNRIQNPPVRKIIVSSTKSVESEASKIGQQLVNGPAGGSITNNISETSKKNFPGGGSDIGEKTSEVQHGILQHVKTELKDSKENVESALRQTGSDATLPIVKTNMEILEGAKDSASDLKSKAEDFVSEAGLKVNSKMAETESAVRQAVTGGQQPVQNTNLEIPEKAKKAVSNLKSNADDLDDLAKAKFRNTKDNILDFQSKVHQQIEETSSVVLSKLEGKYKDAVDEIKRLKSNDEEAPSNPTTMIKGAAENKKD